MTSANLEKLGLGTWAFGGRAYGPMEDEVARSVAKRAYDLGIRFFDTAHLYASGRSEELLGEVIGNLDVSSRQTMLLLYKNYET